MGRRRPQLDPDCIELLRRAETLGLLVSEDLTIAEIREVEKLEREFMGPGQALASVVDAHAPGPRGPIPVRVYTPVGDGPFPAVVFFHGGGWALGSVEHSDANCRSLAAAAGHIVVSVGYRLAPEHPFPAPLDDCYAATAWVDTHRPTLGIDDHPLAVVGTSAGGNLAAAVALIARDKRKPTVGAQILLFPSLDPRGSSESYSEFADGYWPLTRAAMSGFWQMYVRSKDQLTNPYVSPLAASDLSGLPPALIITAEFDVLRDEGEAYGAALAAAGVPVRVSRYEGMVHSFWEYAGVITRAAALATSEIVAALGTLRGVRWKEPTRVDVGESAPR